MPTYQYACTACDERLEAVQSFTDAPLTQCPACGGTLRKVFSAVGVVFKGSGFYKTDSRNGAQTGGSSDKGAASESSGGDKAASGDKAAASSGASTGDGASAKGSSPKGSPTSSPASGSGGSAAPAAAASKTA